jgi:E3 ubiquitin-protein ligase HUWE1
VSFSPFLVDSTDTNRVIELDLPEYETYEDLRKALYTAMTAGGEYFGFA